jgi:DNA primase
MDVAYEVRQIADKYLEGVKSSGPEQIMSFCPFHENKNTPSFTMSLSKGLYHCFSCHESGNLQMFLKNVGVTWNIIQRQYKDVIEGTRSNAPNARHADPFAKRREEEENRPLPEWLLGLFDKIVPDTWAIEEGLDPALLKKMDIGVDEKHGRITFPLRDLSGALVGISGRDYTETSKAKYKVYDLEYKDFDLPQHHTFKSHLLWNGHVVYPHLYYQKMPIISVEGFKACMKVVQAGAFNTVAILGSLVSRQQRWQMERMASEVWLWHDNNEAGFRGTVLSGMNFGLPVRVISYPDERQQPSDLSVEEIQLALQYSKDFTRWLLDTPAAMSLYQERRRGRQNII